MQKMVISDLFYNIIHIMLLAGWKEAVGPPAAVGCCKPFGAVSDRAEKYKEGSI